MTNWASGAAPHAVSIFRGAAERSPHLVPVELRVGNRTEPTEWFVLEDPEDALGLYDRDRLGLREVDGSGMLAIC
ncbi:hypothetical protein CA12_27070 [Alienimonas californiensis]|uniref:Uncharacterized protein n=2 Tax=Alienimonas californiensis TaxID=2527989 RepID=A0A517PB79_9PLAN|nr:hypothetical protein CA12_27070 [Alienimonas californiensis]